jgi:RES domain-containing protein
VVYTSESLALAALETLAHADRRRFERDYVAFRLHIPDEEVMRLDEALPQSWPARPVSTAARQLGDAWLREGSTAALCIPSVLVPLERNYLLNPMHPGFTSITVEDPVVFGFDARLKPAPQPGDEV